MNCGIYKITNIINDKVYIGSSKCLDKRWYEHLWNLKNNKHKNPHLQHSYNKYGNSFVFEIFLYCDEENLLFYEDKAIEEYKSLDSKYGYNCRPATRTDLTGDQYDKWRNKISETKIIKELHKGKNNSMYGKNHTEETINKISETRIKKRIAKGKNNPMHGVQHSKEVRRKISENSSNAKAVIANYKYYRSITEASQDLQIGRWIIVSRIKSSKLGYDWR